MYYWDGLTPWCAELTFFKKPQKASPLSATAFFVVLLFCQIYGVNLFPQLLICSLFFVSTLGVVIVMSETLGHKRALAGGFFCVVLMVWSYGPHVQGVHLFSALGIAASVYISLSVFTHAKNRFALPFTVFVSMICGIFLDAAIMIPWELAIFPLPKAADVMVRSLFYKCSYASLVSLCVGGLHLRKSAPSNFAKPRSIEEPAMLN